MRIRVMSLLFVGSTLLPYSISYLQLSSPYINILLQTLFAIVIIFFIVPATPEILKNASMQALEIVLPNRRPKADDSYNYIIFFMVIAMKGQRVLFTHYRCDD